ncbi:UDP-N-acetylhexosamine pyrophosphorylase [Hydra vulgaris]|uniref:UDP-N-acetylhexosamine pyrophosphorylase n=1 Tax=Hydra vulgaris TaxID=6087 RepID=UPI0002B42047|nr:UDP-N-acetylhexosamine pyrophosphorylase [Hydra vulgaris]XP_012555379.1 UDP-N-acetylhexosamine pyrophosphorylase [Hydra vulgaris]
MEKLQLESLLRPYGQEHLLTFWNELSEDQQLNFEKDLRSIDFSCISDLKKCTDELAKESDTDELIECLPEDICVKKSAASLELQQKWWDDGLKQISEGLSAVLLLAGGQGTRLGVSYPKGMYNVGLPSGKTLYQIQAERILKLQQLAEVKYSKPSFIRWYIMTSEATLSATCEYFALHNYFGLKPENIVIFEQNLVPCLTFDGKIILASKDHIAKSPDGNGGLYGALLKNNIIDDFEKHNVKNVQVYCVDNILVKVADPSFTGFCIERGLECCNKVIEKTDPKEAVGVVCKLKGKYQVVEYSEISKETAEKRSSDGRLLYKHSNICLHYFTVEFLKKVISEHLNELPYHIAKKKIPFVDLSSGVYVEPKSPNGIKLEKFVFDVFPFSSNFAVFEVERSEEFSPLKNGPSESVCSPSSCKNDVSDLHLKYLLNAGAILKQENGKTDFLCEVSPLVSYGGEGLSDYNGKVISKAAIVYIDENHRSPVHKKSKN